MDKAKQHVTVIYHDGKKQTVVSSPAPKNGRIVVIINNQYTNAPNTTQIASGAGKSSAAGNNAAIEASNTVQQQSVGAQGKARNVGLNGKQSQPQTKSTRLPNKNDLVIVMNNQTVKRANRSTASSATQVASGAGRLSAGGTNAAIDSANTKQQHAVGGSKGARAINRGGNSRQKEGKLRSKARGGTKKRATFRRGGKKRK
ncbi:UNVERIFIED_CONTAM: hypothetical protein ABID98_005663 [Brevibacillus sp. OAP136]